MAIEEGIDSHTFFFWDICKFVSRIAITVFVVGLIMLITAPFAQNSAERAGIALATIVTSFETWFVCRFAIVVVKILDTLSSRPSPNSEKRGVGL